MKDASHGGDRHDGRAAGDIQGHLPAARRSCRVGPSVPRLVVGERSALPTRTRVTPGVSHPRISGESGSAPGVAAGSSLSSAMTFRHLITIRTPRKLCPGEGTLGSRVGSGVGSREEDGGHQAGARLTCFPATRDWCVGASGWASLEFGTARCERRIHFSSALFLRVPLSRPTRRRRR